MTGSFGGPVGVKIDVKDFSGEFDICKGFETSSLRYWT